MVRRNNVSPDINTEEDYFGINVGQPDKEKYLGILGSVVKEEDDLADGSGLAVTTIPVVVETSDDQDDQWGDGTVEIKPSDTLDEGPADAEIEEEEEEGEEPDWEAEAESLQVLDDPVRMYLRETVVSDY